MRKIMLFGTGTYGLSLIKYFGRENIQAICDNACSYEGIKYDVRYIPFTKMMDEYEGTILILAMNMNNSRNVIEQLYAYGVYDFLVSTENFMKQTEVMKPENLITLLNNDSERYKLERNQYVEIWRKREEQFAVLKSVVDARRLKPAKGYIKLLQNKLSEFAIDVFKQISELSIRPFLVGGSLLGYYRNGGFIPWDDDLDFGLLRKEYKKLLNYGKNNMIFIEIGASISIDNHKRIENAMKEHPNELIMLVSPNCLQIKRGCSEIDSNIIDFFPYDYYSKDYRFEEHLKLLNDLNQYRYTEVGNSFFEKVITDKRITVDESENIYFGIDNLDSFTCRNETWIRKEIIEPLQPTAFENIPCYVPNAPQELLNYFYKDYMELPNEFSSHHLEEIRANILKTNYTYCGMYISNSCNLNLSIKMYEKLREHGTYCVFILDWFNRGIKQRLETYEVETVENDIEFDIILFDYMTNNHFKSKRMIRLDFNNDYEKK